MESEHKEARMGNFMETLRLHENSKNEQHLYYLIEDIVTKIGATPDVTDRIRDKLRNKANLHLLNAEQLQQINDSLNALSNADDAIKQYVDAKIADVTRKGRVAADDTFIVQLRQMQENLATIQVLTFINQIADPVVPDCGPQIKTLVEHVNRKLDAVNDIQIAKLTSNQIQDSPLQQQIRQQHPPAFYSSPSTASTTSTASTLSSSANRYLDSSGSPLGSTDSSGRTSSSFGSTDSSGRTSSSFGSTDSSSRTGEYRQETAGRQEAASKKYFNLFGGNSSYEQKYLKYKAKYLELKQSHRRF
jgi:hypothetical protein